MSNQEKAFLLVGIILLVIGISLMIEEQILGERTVPAAIVSTLTGITLMINARQKK